MSDVLQLQSFPIVEQIYVYVQEDDIKKSIMLATNGGSTAANMVIKKGKN